MYSCLRGIYEAHIWKLKKEWDRTRHPKQMVRWAFSEVRRREGRREGWPADSAQCLEGKMSPGSSQRDAKERDRAWPQQQHAEASHRSGPVWFGAEQSSLAVWNRSKELGLRGAVQHHAELQSEKGASGGANLQSSTVTLLPTVRLALMRSCYCPS